MIDTDKEALFICDDHAWWSRTVACPSCEANDDAFFGPEEKETE